MTRSESCIDVAVGDLVQAGIEGQFRAALVSDELIRCLPHTVDDQAPELSAAVANAAEIAHHRAQLDERIRNVLAELWLDEQALQELTSDQVYNVELPEGVEGLDIGYLLGNAARALRAAQAIRAHLPA